MLRRCLLLALLCFTANAGAVAFAEVRITHITRGTYSSWCSPSSPHFSTPPFCVASLNGYEVAGADLFIWYVAPGQVLPPGQFFSPAVISLQTNDDAIADRFTVSGVARAEVYAPSFGGFLNTGASAFGDGNAVALVPEPETWTMLLGGFGLLALARRRRSMSMQRPPPK